MGKKETERKKKDGDTYKSEAGGGGCREGMRIQKRKRKRSCAREEEERDRAREQRTD